MLVLLTLAASTRVGTSVCVSADAANLASKLRLLLADKIGGFADVENFGKLAAGCNWLFSDRSVTFAAMADS